MNGDCGVLLFGDGLFIVVKNDDKSVFGFILVGKGRDEFDIVGVFWLWGELVMFKILFISDIW